MIQPDITNKESGNFVASKDKIIDDPYSAPPADKKNKNKKKKKK